MAFIHKCPEHGDEGCLMGESAKVHGCRRGGSFVFEGQTFEREITVIGYLKQVINA